LSVGFPVVVVGVSAGATRFKGYGELHKLCWLSTHNGLSWAFVAPAIFVVLVSIIFIIIIIIIIVIIITL
jgi:hypothetical protein